jgi:hypothetical protein
LPLSLGVPLETGTDIVRNAADRAREPGTIDEARIEEYYGSSKREDGI